MQLKIEISGLCYYAIVTKYPPEDPKYDGLYALLVDPARMPMAATTHDHGGAGGSASHPEHLPNIFIHKDHKPSDGNTDGDYMQFPLTGYFDWLDKVADGPRHTLPTYLTDLLESHCYEFNYTNFKVGGPISAMVPLNFDVCDSVLSPVAFQRKNDQGDCDGGKTVRLAYKFVFSKTLPPADTVEVDIPGGPTQKLVPVSDIVEIRIKNTTQDFAHGADPSLGDKQGDPKHFRALYSLLKPLPGCNKPRDCYPDPIFEQTTALMDRTKARMIGGLYTCMGGGGS